MEADDAGVLAAARAIRPYLTDLVGPAVATNLDHQLAELLNGAPEEPQTVARLRTLLGERETTEWFLAEVLADTPHYRPPYQQPRHRRRIPYPAGDPPPIPAARYTCPQGDYVWYEPEVGTPIPNCPTHSVALTAP